MAGGPAVTGAYSQTLYKDFEKVFFDEYARYPEEWSRVAKIQTWNQYSVKEGQMASFGSFQEINEGGSLPFERPKQGNEKEQTFTNFALGYQITENMKDDDLTGNMRKLPAELGKSAAYSRELSYWDLFNKAFVTTTYTGLDSLALFDTHTLVDHTSTFINYGADALTQSSLQAAIDKFNKLVNEKNIPIPSIPKILVIPPELVWKAEELLMTELKPDTANNNVNAIRNLTNIQYIVCHYLTSTTAWFLLGADHDLRFMWRKKARMQPSYDFNTGNDLHKGTMRYAVAFWDWRHTYGSTGA